MDAQSQQIAKIAEILIDFAKPWIVPSVIILSVTYGVTRFFRKLPREIKALIPIVLGVLAQVVLNRDTFVTIAWYYIGIGIAHGAVLTSIYDIVIKRAKDAIHKDKDE